MPPKPNPSLLLYHSPPATIFHNSLPIMDWQYYKRLLISITGIYAVYLNYGLVQERMSISHLLFIP